MEFRLDGYNFRAKKMSAFEQLHLSRRVSPLLPPLAPLLVEMQKRAQEEDDGQKRPLSADILSLASLAKPFAEVLADMKDQDAEQIFVLALSSVEVETAPGTFIPLWVGKAKFPSVMELNDVAKLLPIVVRVIIHNLGNFMSVLGTSPAEATPVPNGGHSPAAKAG